MKINQSTKSSKKFSLTWFVRRRWNILDLIQIVERGSVPTYLFAEINMTWAEKLRQDLASKGIRITPTALLLKAIAIAQRNHPATRSVLLPWGQTMIMNRIVAGFTVEKIADGDPAVYLGVIHNPDSKHLTEISRELREYGEKDIADVPQLALEERFNHMPWLLRRIILMIGLAVPSIRFRYMPATFGLTSIGKYGIKGVVPPCVGASTFGVGNVEQKAVVCEGKIEICPMMDLILNFDHRLIDGAPASRFLSDIQKLMEGQLADYMDESAEYINSNLSQTTVNKERKLAEST